MCVNNTPIHSHICHNQHVYKASTAHACRTPVDTFEVFHNFCSLIYRKQLDKNYFPIPFLVTVWWLGQRKDKHVYSFGWRKLWDAEFMGMCLDSFHVFHQRICQPVNNKQEGYFRLRRSILKVHWSLSRQHHKKLLSPSSSYFFELHISFGFDPLEQSSLTRKDAEGILTRRHGKSFQEFQQSAFLILETPMKTCAPKWDCSADSQKEY